MTTKVQFAFQGGGAKLGALIAAAEAVYSQQKPLDFTISRVSGTSAGAIAACILATGQDPKKFKDRLIELANSNLDKICKTDNSEIPGHAEITSRPEKSGTWKVIQLCEEYRVLLSKAAVLGFHLWRGHTLYDSVAYLKFLEDLFNVDSKKYVHLKDLDPNIDIFIHAVDIRTREPKIYTKKDGVTIAQALFDSSALPFIFKTFHDTTGIFFDGGLVNNFPSERLLEDNQFGYVAGFSFDPEPVQLQFTSLKDFTGALVSTMMDNATKQSLAKLPEGDVHYIKTNTSTLDFRGALKNDLIGQNYGGYINYAKSFLADFITRKRMQHAALPTQELARRILHFHDALKAQQKVRVSKIVLTLKSNSLKVRNLANPASVDEFYQSCELVPETPAYTFGFRLAIEDKAFNPGDIHSGSCHVWTARAGDFQTQRFVDYTELHLGPVDGTETETTSPAMPGGPSGRGAFHGNRLSRPAKPHHNSKF